MKNRKRQKKKLSPDAAFLGFFLKLYISFLLVVLLLNAASKCSAKMSSGVSVLRKAVMCLVGENMNVR